ITWPVAAITVAAAPPAIACAIASAIASATAIEAVAVHARPTIDIVIGSAVVAAVVVAIVVVRIRGATITRFVAGRRAVRFDSGEGIGIVGVPLTVAVEHPLAVGGPVPPLP